VGHAHELSSTARCIDDDWGVAPDDAGDIGGTRLATLLAAVGGGLTGKAST
jgi:hypothetical protein